MFTASFRSGISERLGAGLAERIVAGGYPAALARRTAARRRAWYRDYIETQIQRDVRDLARIYSLDSLSKLLALAANHTATLLNVADLAAPFELTRQTIHDYVTLLEQGHATVAGVEVKAAATVTAGGLRGLRKLRDAAGKRFAACVVLYDGSATISFGDGLHAVPLRALWETT